MPAASAFASSSMKCWRLTMPVAVAGQVAGSAIASAKSDGLGPQRDERDHQKQQQDVESFGLRQVPETVCWSSSN